MKRNGFTNNIISIIIVSLLLTGCSSVGLAHDATFSSEFDNTEETPANIYVSSGKVIFRSFDSESETVYFDVIENDETVALNYDGATVVSGKYGEPMSMAQLRMGDVVNIAYNSSLNKVGAIVINPDINEIDNVSRFSLSENMETFYIGDEAYNLTPGVKVYSSGERIDPERLIKQDGLTVFEEGRNIVSIRVEDGHGYLELQNEDALIGGWIEAGQTMISQIMEGMLFTLPEGEYNVRLSNEGIDEYRDISIVRNEVTTLDLSDIESTIPEKGLVHFRIYPQTATTYVDGNYINTSYAVKLPVGMHEITVADDGYYTVSEYFEVTGLDQEVSIDLDLETVNEVASVSGNNVNKNLYATITVENPEEAELYEDNVYKGVTPVTYQKIAGTHTLTLRKPGYITTSYTIVVNDDGMDQSFSFPDMEREGDEEYESVSGNSLVSSSKDLNGNSVSGNSVSGNSVSQNRIE